jgi:hypothetical protein
MSTFVIVPLIFKFFVMFVGENLLLLLLILEIVGIVFQFTLYIIKKVRVSKTNY